MGCSPHGGPARERPRGRALVAWWLTAGVVWGCAVPSRAAAQPDPSARAQAPETTPAGGLVDRLPVSLERIKRRLAQQSSERSGPLRLEFYVEVHGKAPRLDLLADFDLVHGPVPAAPPTHRDILEMVTPEEFRSPPVDLLTPIQALFEWLRRQAAAPTPR